MPPVRSILATLAAIGVLVAAPYPARAADGAPAAPVVPKLISGPEPASPALATPAATAATATAPTPAAASAKPATSEAPASPPAAAPVKAAAPAAPPKPETTLLIDIDLTRQRMTLTEHGKVTGSWPISSGREGYRSPTGTFRPLWMSKMWYSKKYDNAPMPNAVFFSGGVAMHATQATGMLGRPASHGCIRQSPANAATTYKLVTKHGNAHTKIVVHGTPRDDEPRVARASRPASELRSAAAASYRSQPAMRRVILVDGAGNRRIGEIPASDPRLVAYQRRILPMGPAPRPYYAQGGYYGRSDW